MVSVFRWKTGGTIDVVKSKVQPNLTPLSLQDNSDILKVSCLKKMAWKKILRVYLRIVISVSLVQKEILL